MFIPEIINVISDENGKTIFFETKEEAQDKADECQIGLVVSLWKGSVY